MRDYEFTLILKAELDEQTRTELIQRIVSWIPTPEGDDVPEPTIEHWGRRQLAYPINKLTDGYYVYIEAAMDPAGIAEMERNVRFVDDILRHLVVRKEG